ncbi:MAG TPA: hypothetical protein DDW50_06740, partial [Firmicutes bacterium]|nr:hypothetical protein [Bacillota bacterium]
IMVAAIILFISKARNPAAYWMSLILLGWGFSMSGLILFISKYGGFYYKVNLILFLTDSIRRFLLEFPISIDLISRMISAGRSLFVFSLVGFAISLNYKKKTQKKWNLYLINSIFPILNVLVYDPYIYKNFFGFLERKYIFIISLATRAWFITSVLIALFLMVKGYQQITIPLVKNKLKNFYPGILVLTLFYCYLGFMGPLQVTDVRTYYFLYSDFSNYNPPLSLWEWYIGVIFTGLTSLVSILSIWKYTEVENKLGKADLQLERKFKIANTGARVFTHAIKNQLIMAKLLLDKTTNQIQNETFTSPDAAAQIRQNIDNISDIVNYTLNRLDQLYKPFKGLILKLEPTPVRTILQQTLDKFKTVPANISLEYNFNEANWSILADSNHLTEALSNIIINAFEAIHEQTGGTVKLDCNSEENWCIIKIRDNGCGIPKGQINNIFDPFYTNKNTNKNWGVGLSYTKQVIKEHFGYIYVDSEVGAGTVFKILLPVYRVDDY